MMEFPEYDATDTYKCRHDISKMIYPTTQQQIYILKNVAPRWRQLHKAAALYFKCCCCSSYNIRRRSISSGISRE